MSTKHCVVEITDSKKFDFILSNYQNKLIVVDFTASWCGPCQRIKPYFHECSNLYKDKCLCLSVDVDKFPELAKTLEAKNNKETNTNNIFFILFPSLFVLDKVSRYLRIKSNNQY